MRRYGAREAEERIVKTIMRFAISQGHEEKYHGTLTRAWLRLVATAQHLTPNVTAFDELLAKHRWLLDRSALSAFYSYSVPPLTRSVYSPVGKGWISSTAEIFTTTER